MYRRKYSTSRFSERVELVRNIAIGVIAVSATMITLTTSAEKKHEPVEVDFSIKAESIENKESKENMAPTPELYGGIATIFKENSVELEESMGIEVENDYTMFLDGGNDIVYEYTAYNENSTSYNNPVKIRCTGYNDIGYTKSGEYTRQGIVAGKKEWLHKKCKLYRVNSDGTCGDLIGTYEFLDTGFGLDELNGVAYPNGTISAGKSIDVWHSSEEAVWNWMSTYGDYVYMQFID